MKAITQDAYGSPDVLRLAEVDVPVPGPGEVLVQVRAAAVDYGVWHLLTGRPLLTRALGFGLRKPKVPVAGSDLAGMVTTAGPGFAVGDAVFGSGVGTFAEYAVAPVGKLAHKPPGLTFEQAAALPVSGCTALQGLRGLASGQRVLVIGAAGGVGSIAVLLAKARGAHVTGVCRTSKIDLVRSLGADEVIDYTSSPLSGRYDLILDTGGNRSLKSLREHLAVGGSLVLVGGENGGPLLGGFDRQLRAPIVGAFTRQKMRGLIAFVRAEDLRELASLGVQPAIDRTYPLAEAAEAVRRLERGEARGKIVITVQPA
jgi:NADPH:quinone reductase-like Zn-dependent oxidoreductase